MKDREFEQQYTQWMKGIMDPAYKGLVYNADEVKSKESPTKAELEDAFLAGFDFEENFEDWYNKRYKNGTG